MIEALGRLILSENGGRPLDTDRALSLIDTADPMLRVTTMLLASHVLENDGRVDEALRVARAAAAEPVLAESLWARVVNQTRVAELAASSGDYAEAESMAEHAMPMLERFGAHGDVVSLRWLLAMVHLQRADVAGAAEQLQVAGYRAADDSFGEGTTGLTIRAELDLAEGNVEVGLRRYRAAVEHAEQRSSLAPFVGDETTTPWVTMARAGSLIAHAVHGRLAEATRLPLALTQSLRDVMAADESTGPLSLVIRIDLPVCGCAVLGLSYALSAAATTPAERAHAARGVALSDALGISRTPPAFAHARAEELAIRTDAAAYASAQELYAAAGRDESLKLLGQWLEGLPQSWRR